MPAIPWLKLLPYIGVLLLVGGAIAWIDHQGFKRAKTQAELARARDDNLRLQIKSWMQQQVSIYDRKLQEAVNQNDQNLGDRLSRLDIVEKNIIQPTITREIMNGPPRLTDPNLGLTDGLWAAINSARARSGSPCVTNADGSATCELSEPAATQGQVDSNTGK